MNLLVGIATCIVLVVIAFIGMIGLIYLLYGATIVILFVVHSLAPLVERKEPTRTFYDTELLDERRRSK